MGSVTWPQNEDTLLQNTSMTDRKHRGMLTKYRFGERSPRKQAQVRTRGS